MSEQEQPGLTAEEAADRRAAYEAQRREWSEAWREADVQWRAEHCAPEPC